MSILSRTTFSGVLKTYKGSSLSSRLLPRNHQSEPKSRITSYLSSKYDSLRKSYEETLRKKFPIVMSFYEKCSLGLKLFKEDTLILYKGYKKVRSQGWHSLTRKELEVYYLMPKDIIRTAPLIIVGAGIPFCGFVFVIAFYFPRQMLPYHFWSLQQRKDFSIYYHKKSLENFKPLYLCMENLLSSIEGNPLQEPMKEIFKCLGSGLHPTADLILSCKPLFEKSSYSLSNLSRNHIVGLLKLHNMHRGWKRRKRLELRANFLHLTDAAIVREGGLEKLSDDDIRWICFFRGLNPTNMTQEEIFEWMNTWLLISQQIDKNSYSLLLHCPILLGCNQISHSCSVAKNNFC